MNEQVLCFCLTLNWITLGLNGLMIMRNNRRRKLLSSLIDDMEYRLREWDGIVRCSQCTYRHKAKPNEKGFLICPASGMEITDVDFCSYGEREGFLDERND